MSARPARRWGATVLLLLSVACQQQPTAPATAAPPTSPATSPPTSRLASPATSARSAAPTAATAPRPAASAATATPAPSRSATAARPVAAATATRPAASAVAPLAVGAARGDVLNAADAAFQAGNTGAAIELYDRVLNTPPTGEPPALASAMAGLARFRAMLALVTAGRDEEARQQLAGLREHDPNGPLTSLAAQFWDQYGMTAQARTACAQLKPQLGTAEPVLGTLRAAGVVVASDSLCSVPGG